MATEGREFGWEDTIKEDAQEFEPLTSLAILCRISQKVTLQR